MKKLFLGRSKGKQRFFGTDDLLPVYHHFSEFALNEHFRLVLIMYAEGITRLPGRQDTPTVFHVREIDYPAGRRSGCYGIFPRFIIGKGHIVDDFPGPGNWKGPDIKKES